MCMCNRVLMMDYMCTLLFYQFCTYAKKYRLPYINFKLPHILCDVLIIVGIIPCGGLMNQISTASFRDDGDRDFSS